MLRRRRWSLCHVAANGCFECGAYLGIDLDEDVEHLERLAAIDGQHLMRLRPVQRRAERMIEPELPLAVAALLLFLADEHGATPQAIAPHGSLVCLLHHLLRHDLARAPQHIGGRSSPYLGCPREGCGKLGANLLDTSVVLGPPVGLL